MSGRIAVVRVPCIVRRSPVRILGGGFTLIHSDSSYHLIPTTTNCTTEYVDVVSAVDQIMDNGNKTKGGNR